MATYNEIDIAQAVEEYAVFHGVEVEEVTVLRRFDEGNNVVGFCLSLDRQGNSFGYDERYGEW